MMNLNNLFKLSESEKNPPKPKRLVNKSQILKSFIILTSIFTLIIFIIITLYTLMGKNYPKNIHLIQGSLHEKKQK